MKFPDGLLGFLVIVYIIAMWLRTLLEIWRYTLALGIAHQMEEDVFTLYQVSSADQLR